MLKKIICFPTFRYLTETETSVALRTWHAGGAVRRLVLLVSAEQIFSWWTQPKRREEIQGRYHV